MALILIGRIDRTRDEEKVGAKNDTWVSYKSHWYNLLKEVLEEKLIWLGLGAGMSRA